LVRQEAFRSAYTPEFSADGKVQRFDTATTQVVHNPPQIVEHIHRNVVQQIQPVIIRETVIPVVQVPVESKEGPHLASQAPNSKLASVRK